MQSFHLSRTLAALAVGCAFYACTYSTDDFYVNPIEEPTSIPVYVDIESPDFTDPYYLDYPTTFVLNISRTQRTLLEHHVTLNGIEIFASYENFKISFTLTPGGLGVGTHNIGLAMVFKSESGSMADQLGAEAFFIEDEFSVIVDNTPVQVIDPLTASIENGFLTLRWKVDIDRPIDFSLFVQAPSFSMTRTIKGLTPEGTYVDSSYVGKPTTYHLSKVNAFGQQEFGFINVNTRPTKFTLTSATGTPTQLSWTSTISHANVSVIGPGGAITVPVTQGSLELDSLFLGDELEYRVMVSRNLYAEARFDSVVKVSATRSLLNFSELKVANSEHFVFLKDGEIYKARLSDFKRTDSSHTSFFHSYSQFRVSNSGAYIAAISYGNSFPLLLNPDNLSEQVVHRAAEVSPEGPWVYLGATNLTEASPAGLIGGNSPSNGSPRAVIYDLNVNGDTDPLDVVIWKDSVNEDTPNISPDGGYFCLNSTDQQKGEVYKLINTEWTNIGFIPTGHRTFRGNSSTEIVLIGNTVRIYDLSQEPATYGPFQLIREMQLSAVPGGSRLGQVGYDAVSQHIFIQTIDQRGYSTIRVYDVQTFTLLAKGKAFVSPPPIYTHQINVRHVYSGGYQFVSSGYGQKIIE